jgi:hypothetical protein
VFLAGEKSKAIKGADWILEKMVIHLEVFSHLTLQTVNAMGIADLMKSFFLKSLSITLNFPLNTSKRQKQQGLTRPI